MKKYLLIILCACFSLLTAANGRMISRAQLKTVTKQSALIGRPMTSSGGASSRSLPQYLKEHKLTLNDNRFNKSVSLGATKGLESGDKIVMVDAYDFDWDFDACEAVVVDTSYFFNGKMSHFIQSYDCSSSTTNDDMYYLTDFYEDYSIPFEVDTSSMTVRLVTGVLLGEITGFYDEYNGGNLPFLSSPQITDRDYYVQITRRIYAMPESWLTDSNVMDYGDIYGSIYDDGSISLDDGFGFLIESIETPYSGGQCGTTSVFWGLSPIFRNCFILTPNARHKYDTWFLDNTPYPSDETDYVSLAYISDVGETTTSGVVHRPIQPRPVKPKPVAPRPITPPNSYLALSGDDGTAGAVRPLKSADKYSSPWDGNDISDASRLSVPVYIYKQDDDSTYLIYNLYGADYSWDYMILHHDGSVSFPSQNVNIDKSAEESIYNCSITEDSVMLDNTGLMIAGDTIIWNDTYLFSESGLQNRYYRNNKLYYNDHYSGFFLHPIFKKPILTDNTVTFSAYSLRSDATVTILEYDAETGDTIAHGDTYTTTRGDVPRLARLHAYASVQVGDEWIYSDYNHFLYRIPPFFMPGDVNDDRTVNIVDVTMLIDYLLTPGQGENAAFHLSEADVNRDDEITIADVTLLIDLLLQAP